MGKKWYGNIINRIEEGRTVPEIKVGMDITMYYWSDRHCYYVTEVIDQKHIEVKEYEVVADHEKATGMGHQAWLYFKSRKECNEYLNRFSEHHYEENPEEAKEQEWVFRYNKWKEKYIGYDGEVHYQNLQPISFGVLSYYYDWEF